MGGTLIGITLQKTHGFSEENAVLSVYLENISWSISRLSLPPIFPRRGKTQDQKRTDRRRGRKMLHDIFSMTDSSTMVTDCPSAAARLLKTKLNNST